MNQHPDEGIARFKTAAERVRSGALAAEEVDLPSGKVRLTSDPEAPTGIRITVLEGAPDDRAGDRVDPEMRKGLDRIKESIERFRAGDMASMDIPLPSGGTMNLTRDESTPGAFVARSSDGGPSMRSVPFPPSSERPQAFPEDLPFLPQCAAALSEMEGGLSRSLTWFVEGDPEEILRDLREQLSAGGWVETGDSRSDGPFGALRWMGFRRGGLDRVLSIHSSNNRAQIMLMEQTRSKP